MEFAAFEDAPSITLKEIRVLLFKLGYVVKTNIYLSKLGRIYIQTSILCELVYVCLIVSQIR